MDTTLPVFRIENLSVSYGIGSAHRKVLDDVNFSIRQGEMVAIQGPSGSGKSTLFYVLGCMLKPEDGEVWFRDQNINKLSDFELSLFRNRNIGFVFQQFHLLQRATVLDNILLPSRYPVEMSRNGGSAVARAKALAEKMGLGELLGNLPNQLSGGQQQRVAIARALMNDVDVILADEPTGNLDTENARLVLEILGQLHKDGKTVVIITHDNEVAQRCPRRLLVKDGKISDDKGKSSPSPIGEKSKPPKKQKAKQDPWLGLVRILPLAMQNILRNRMRSILTMVGVSIGVGAVVAMLTLGNYTRQRILEGYESLGVNRLSINGDRDWMRSAINLSPVQFNSFDVSRDLLPLREVFPEVTLISPVSSSWGTKLTYGGKTITDNLRTFGVNHEYLKILNAKLARGSPISQHHVELRSGVCIIGDQIQTELSRGKTLLGEIITVGSGENLGYPCRVIGILAPQKSAIESFQPDRQILLPYTYLQANQNYWEARIRNFMVTLRSGSDVETVGMRIKGFFDLKYDGTGIFRVDSNSTLVAQMKRFLNIFAFLLAGIAFLALLVGGIGIQNMMLVSIADRLKEIGLRKAVGATNQSIKQQILFEAMLLCGAAGVVGLVGGIGSCLGLLLLATKMIPDLKFEIIVDPTAVAISCIAIVAVGILSGLAPAVKAERLQVIEALRAE